MKFNEFGRSMVEMLGVLAIIGVLSVGAISGYSKAMMKYKLNKQAELVSNILNFLITNVSIFKAQKSYQLTPYLIKLQICEPNRSNNACTSIFDNFIAGETIILEDNKSYMYLSVALLMKGGIYNISDDMVKQCENLIQIGKQMSSTIDYINIDGIKQSLYGDKECNNRKNQDIYCLRQMNIQDIYKICSTIKEAKDFYRIIYYLNTGKI